MRIFFCIFCTLLSLPLRAATDPTEINVKVLAVYMSKDPYCTSPVEVFTTAEPGFVDFLGGPTIGQLDNSKNLYDGTYRCFIVKMSETIQYVPLVGSGTCVAGNRFSTNLCGAGIVTTGADGTPFTCTADSGDEVFIYLSTVSSATSFGTSANPFAPPTVGTLTNGMMLTSGISITGAINLKFIVNGFGKIGAVNSTCALTNPVFDIKTN